MESEADCGNCVSAQEEARDDCYPARVHATLDLLDRHLATMRDQLTPKPLPGRAPPKKVVRPHNTNSELMQCKLCIMYSSS